MPCSSGNSPTMRGQQVALGELRRALRRARGRRRSRGAISPRQLRDALAPCRRWSRAAPGRSPRRAPARARPAACLRSCSQKKAASARRGRTTRSLPARTTAGSRLSMLLTVMNQGSSCRRRVLHREVALVILQRRDQHFARQREEALLEAAGDRHRPFDQRRDFIEQRLARSARGRPALRRQRADLRADALARARRSRAITRPRLEQRPLVAGGRA